METVLQRIASGDKTAVQDCLNKYGGLIWSLARRMSPNSDDAEDAVQEIFTDVWKNAARFDETQASETTFIAMIARRRLIDRLRKSQRQVNADSIEEVLNEPSKDYTREMQVCIEAKEVAKVMKDLRPEQQKVLYLSIVQGLSHQEIADLTQMPVGTVKTHARRGLIQIRELLNVPNSDKEVSA